MRRHSFAPTSHTRLGHCVFASSTPLQYQKPCPPPVTSTGDKPRLDLPPGPRPAILKPVPAHNHPPKGNAARIGSWLPLAAVVMLCAWLGGGCRSVKGPGHESLAAVVISGPTPFDIARTVSEVFQKAGYKPVPIPANDDMRLVFEKPAGAMATLLYGDWTANKVWSRVKVRIDGLDGGGQLVTCNLYRVTDHGDANFEIEHKVSTVKKGPYRELLNRVKARATHAAP